MSEQPAEEVDGRTLRAQRRRKKRREEILTAATEVIGTNGYQATSIADVIEAAGIARGTFYLYFDSRDALFRELIDRFVGILINSVQAVDPGQGDAVDRLYENVHRVVEVLFEHRDLTRLLLREAVGVDEEVDRKLATLDIYMRAMLVGALTKGAEAGWIRPVEHPEIVATAIVGSLKEVLYQALCADQLPHADADAVAQAIFDFGSRGLFE